MKITLTITGEGAPDEKRIFREIFALLNGSTASTPLPVPTPIPGNDDDDEGTAPAVVAPGEVDASGFPWDERIHSGAKTKTELGNWRKRKGIDDGVFAGIMAELKARGYGVSGSTAPVPAPVVPVSVTPPTMAFAPPAPIATAPVPTPIPVAAPAPIPTPTPDPVPAPAPVAVETPDFAGIMQVITNGVAAGKITPYYLQQVATIYGLGDNVANMADKPEMRAAVWAQLKADGHAS